MPRLLAALFGFLPPCAWAYLDPGAASLLLQAIAASLAAASFFLVTSWSRLRSWLRRFVASRRRTRD